MHVNLLVIMNRDRSFVDSHFIICDNFLAASISTESKVRLSYNGDAQ